MTDNKAEMTDDRAVNTKQDVRVTFILNDHPLDEPINARRILNENPEFLTDSDLVLNLAFEQYIREIDLGRTVDIDAFVELFPEIADPAELRDLLKTHAGLLGSPDIRSLMLGEFDWPEPGDVVFQDLELQRELGQGAASRVYLAKELSAGDREVVVKICIEGCGPGNEANILGRLSHPNIGQILSVKRDGDRFSNLYALCMPYDAQTTLRDKIDERCTAGDFVTDVNSADEGATADSAFAGIAGADVNQVIRFGERIADALAYTHEEGFLHGDVKPSNVLVAEDGKPILIDFNLSSRRELNEGMTGGTIVYMAPEQFSALLGESVADDNATNQSMQHACDVFSFGVTFYEFLTGRLPFGEARDLRNAKSIFEEPGLKDVVREYRTQQRQARVRIREEFPQLPAALAETLQQCLAFDPAERPSFKNIAANLQSLMPAAQAQQASAKRRGWYAVIASLAVAVSVIAAVPFVRQPAVPPPGLQQTLLQKAEESFLEEDFEDADRYYTAAAKVETPTANVLARHGVSKLQVAMLAEKSMIRYRQSNAAVALLEKSVEVGFTNPKLLREFVGRCRTIMNQNREGVVKTCPPEFRGLAEAAYLKKVKDEVVGHATTDAFPELAIIEYACHKWPANLEMRQLAIVFHARVCFETKFTKQEFKDRLLEHWWCLREFNGKLPDRQRRTVVYMCSPVVKEPEFQLLIDNLRSGLNPVLDPVKHLRG